MAAHLDFEYLHQLAVSDADHRALERIESDRQNLLRGRPLPAPGRYMELRLKAPKAAQRPAGSEHTHITLILRSDLAPASLDTFLEIFRDRAHTSVAGFAGEDARTILDLGANEGYYTLLMKRFNPGLRIVAAEPLTENADLFRRNIESNGLDDVTCIEAAVTAPLRITTERTTPGTTATGSAQGTIGLDTYPYVGTVASTDISAFPRPWIDPARVRPRRVAAITLSALLDRARVAEADILKVDVEGSEVDILSGAVETSAVAGTSTVTGTPAAADVLRRFRRIVVECHGAEKRDQVLSVLERASFFPVHVEGKRSGDVYAERR
ncbi:MAG: FkbM family methyltransferase [Spirochaetes bacterium]|jgi:FkbM family methyltransferase|nr:FkbM family methyltransferase [Spirochaetota bacterium]